MMHITEWEACNYPPIMLDSIPRQRWMQRKLRLFAAECCRRIGAGLAAAHPGIPAFVALAEDYADGRVTFADLFAGRPPRTQLSSGVMNPTTWRVNEIQRAAFSLAEDDAWNAAVIACRHAAASAREHRLPDGVDGDAEEQRAQAKLLRDVLATLYRPRPDVAWIGPHFDTITNLAAGIYREHAFGDLPILGDALEEAGCPQEELIAHCRGGGLHCRGCWVVDALLGKA